MAKNLLKTVEGIDIFVDSETGQFSAKMGGKEIKKRNLRDVEKEIEKTSDPVIAYEVDRYHIRKAKRVEIIGFEGTRARMKDGRLAESYSYFYLLTEEEIEELDKLYEAQEAIESQWTEIVNGLKEKRLDSLLFRDARKAQSETPKP